MFDELFKKFPEIVRMLIQKASQNNNSKEMDKLLYQIKCATEEMDRLSKVQGEGLSQEQMETILKMPRPVPKQYQWQIKKK